MANELKIGDRVRHRDQPWVHGTVWSMQDHIPPYGDRIIVAWDNRDENSFCLPEKLVKISRRPYQGRPSSRGQG